MAEPESTSETASGVGALTIAGKNGGRLRNGGTNRGGPGRPPSSFRALCRKRFQRHLPKLDKLIKKADLKDSDLIAIMGLFARYASEQAVPVPEIRRALAEQAAIVRSFEHLSPEHAEALLQQMKPVWARL